MLKHCTNFLSQNPGLRLEGRTLLLAGVNRLGWRWSNLSMSFLVHAGASNTPPPYDTIMLNHHSYFPSQNSALGFEGRGLLLARVDWLGQRHGTNLGTSLLVHTGPTDMHSTEMPALGTIDVTDKDVETEENLWNLYERWLSIYRPEPLDLNEKQRRFKAFMDKARFIHDFSKKEDTTFTVGLNQFADLTNAEFCSTYLNEYPESDP